jgi:hypothetical protein
VILLATIQWHPRLAPFWCAGLLLGVAAWGWLLWRRLKRRAPVAARWIALPKWITPLLLAFASLAPEGWLANPPPMKPRPSATA